MTDLSTSSFYAASGQYLVGPKGDTGDTGPQGPLGPVGPQGPSGSVTAAAGAVFSSKDNMAAAVSPIDGQAFFLFEPDGTASIWKFRAIDLHAKVTQDVYRGMYVAPAAPADTTGTSGAFVRQLQALEISAAWFGVGAANQPTNNLRLRSIEQLRWDGSTVRLPAEDMSGFGPVAVANEAAWAIIKPGRFVGQGYATRIRCAVGVEQHIIAVNASNVTLENFRIEGAYGNAAADGKFCIQIGTRYNSSATGAVVQNVKVLNMWIGDSNEGIRVCNGGYLEGGRAVWYHPKGIEITGCRFYNIGYQCFSLWGRGVNVHHNWVTMSDTGSPETPGVARSFQAVFRICGGSQIRINSNLIEDKFGFPVFIFQTSNEDSHASIGPYNGAEFNDARNVLVSDNHFKCKGLLAYTYEFAGTILWANNIGDRPLELTDEAVAFYFDNPGSDQKRGTFIVEGGHYSGYVKMLLHAEGAFKRIVFRNGSSISNACASPEAPPASVFAVNYIGITGYNGTVVKPVESLEVLNWVHDGRDAFYNYFVRYHDKPAASFVEVRGCSMPFGTGTALAFTGTGAGPFENSANVTRPTGHWNRLVADSTGYAHSPRYSDDNPLGGGPPTYDPNFPNPLFTPIPVEED